MPEKKLKEAILKNRNKGMVTPDNMTLFLQQIAREILSGHIETLQAEIQQHGSELKAKMSADAEVAFKDFLQKNWEHMRGEPGTPGVVPTIDIKAIAAQAATLVPTPKIDHAEIAKKAATLVEIKDIDEDALAQKAAALLPVNTPMSLEDMLAKIHEAGISMETVKGLPKLLRDIQRIKREGGGTMMHGGGMTLVAGSNVTLTRNINGTYTVAASSSGSTPLVATETPNGVLTVFTFTTATAKPSYIFSDNVRLAATSKAGTVNWTWNNGTKKATMTIPPNDDIEGIV